jgi:uncharacterized protein
MTPGILDRSIDWIAENGVGQVQMVFLGGEPTLEPLLIERAVSRARRWEAFGELSFDFTMTTNFLSLDEPLAGKLAEWRVAYLLSVDGFGPRHDRSRPARDVPSAFAVLAERIGMLQRYQPWLGARVTSTPATVEWLREDLGRLEEMGFRQFIISPASGIPWTDEALACFRDQLIGYARGRKRGAGDPIPYISPVDDPPKGRYSWGCGAGRGRYSIDPSGKIFSCARFAGMASAEPLDLGNIWDGIDPHGNVVRFQDESYATRPGCLNCAIREDCLGGCPAVNWEEAGSLTSPAINECRMMRIIEAVRSAVKIPSWQTANLL